MGPRPLRQYYGDTLAVRFDGLDDVVATWDGHRRRFTERLAALDEAQWRAPTRCSAWNVTQVVNHLTTAYGFWALTLRAALDGQPPSSYLSGFDPTTSPPVIIASLADRSPSEALDALTSAADAVTMAARSFDGANWGNRCESPFGHLPAPIILAHNVWDSWLHERDIFVPLGDPPPVTTEELQLATWFSLFFIGAQGGVVGDPEPVGALPTGPIAVDLCFDDLAGLPVRLDVDAGVGVTPSHSPQPIGCGSALDFVETVAGRQAGGYAPDLPAALTAQIERAAHVL